MHSGVLKIGRTRSLPRRGTSVSGGTSPGRRRRVHRVRKLLSRSPRAAPAITKATPRPSTLGLITDTISGQRCLVDTGSQVSLWPPTSSTSRIPTSRLRLTAANGSPIKCFGQQRREIQIGGKSYSFVFLFAQVVRPILGLDFLQQFKMTLDLGRRRLIHSGKETSLSSVSSAISGVNVVRAPSTFINILQEYPEVTDVKLASRTTKHGVECYINTSGPPVTTAPRRLTPEKLEIAKQYFEVMCAAGICRRSDSPWSSGLHMVPKKDGTVRPCGDYRRLNERTSVDAYPLPHIHDFTALLVGAKIFSKIDLVKGYHQIPVRAEDVPKAAISTPFGLFEFLRMPFGLKNAAQTFQRMMDSEPKAQDWMLAWTVYLVISNSVFCLCVNVPSLLPLAGGGVFSFSHVAVMYCK